jgi:transcriptional regulator with XRE-family HTH domain
MKSELNYEVIGQQIAKARKEKHYTQDDLSYECECSKVHLSHIERGTTKLSLQALVTIANNLNVGTDFLLYSNLNTSTQLIYADILDEFKDCTPYEMAAMLEQARLTKKSLRNAPKTSRGDDDL